jgi:hypothetical protein
MFKELCLYMMLNWGIVDVPSCENVAVTAQEMGAEKYIYELLSIGWHESRFNPSAVSGSFVGVLQANPRWAAECEDCNEIQIGIHIFLKFKTKDRCLHISRFMNGWSGTCDARVQKRVDLAAKIKRLHTRIKRGKILVQQP